MNSQSLKKIISLFEFIVGTGLPLLVFTWLSHSIFNRGSFVSDGLPHGSKLVRSSQLHDEEATEIEPVMLAGDENVLDQNTFRVRHLDKFALFRVELFQSTDKF